MTENLWLRSAKPRLAAAIGPDAGTDPLARRIDPSTLAGHLLPEEPPFTRLLVGGPGQALPGVDEVAEVIRSMPPEARDGIIVTVFGAEPSRDRNLAQALADALDMPIRARHGLIMIGADRKPGTYAVDAMGVTSWQPFAQVSLYQPDRLGATVERWRDPIPGAFALGHGSYRLTGQWTIDVVPAGLVVRPAIRPPDMALRCAPTDPERVDLLIDTTDGESLPDDMLTSLARLADALPVAARARLHLILPAGVKDSIAWSLRCAVPAPQSTYAEPAVDSFKPARASEMAPGATVLAPLAVMTMPTPSTLVVNARGHMLLR